VTSFSNNERKNRVLIEATMEQWVKTAIGLKTWAPMHLALYAGSHEIRLYQHSVDAAWG
jgi:hypothetical protein